MRSADCWLLLPARYAKFLEETAEELYDHRKDPREFTNVAGDKRYAKELARHRAITSERRGV